MRHCKDVCESDS